MTHVNAADASPSGTYDSMASLQYLNQHNVAAAPARGDATSALDQEIQLCLSTILSVPPNEQLQAEGVTHHNIRFRATDLRRYERRLLASFRTSTSERQLSSAILLERRWFIRTLQYMQSKAFLLDYSGRPDAPTPSAQQVTRDFFHKVCCERGAAVPKEAEAIEAAMQIELYGIQAGRVICDQSLRAGRAVTTMDLEAMRISDRPSRPARDAIAAVTPGRRSLALARAERVGGAAARGRTRRAPSRQRCAPEHHARFERAAAGTLLGALLGPAHRVPQLWRVWPLGQGLPAPHQRRDARGGAARQAPGEDRLKVRPSHATPT